MLTKLIFPDAFDFGMPAATLVPMHSRGVDRGFIQKRAAMFDDFLDKFERRPGHSYIHLISVGAMERYAGNNNGDSFPKEASLHVCVEPAKGASKVTMLDGGLEKYHNLCFEKNAKVYKNHQNSHKKGTPSGYIAKAAINQEMDRGELLIGVETDKWEKELQKLAEDKPVFFSMGCFAAGARVQMADSTYRPIQDVVVGDVVMSHLGHAVNVLAVRAIEHESVDQISMQPAGLGSLLSCTTDHPILAVSRECVQEADGRVRQDVNPLAHAIWKRADKLLPTDYLLMPIDRTELTPDYVTQAFARFAGYYLAEGSLVYRGTEPVGIRLSLSEDDVILKRLDELVAELGMRRNFSVSHVKHAKAVSATVMDGALAKQMLMLFGSGAHNKRLFGEVLQWRRDRQMQLLGAYVDGDGGFVTSHHTKTGYLRGSAYVTSCSRDLLHDVQRMLARWGYVPCITAIRHKGRQLRGRAIKPLTSYMLHFGLALTDELHRYSDKVQPQKAQRDHCSGARFVLGDYVLVKVKRLAAMTGPLVVYNMEVDADEHSYLVEGFAVHNCDTPADLCSYCHHRSHTRDEYDDHLRNDMLTITKEGHQITAITDTPYFHDISGVVKPAEKISFGLRKVASGAIIGSAELAEMYGLTPRIETVRRFLSKRAADQEELLRKLADIEKELLLAPAGAPEKALIDSFAPESGHGQCCSEALPELKDKPCGEVLGALKKNLVVLPLDVFLGLISGDAPEGLMPKLAEVRSSLPGVFGRLLGDPGLAEFLGDSSYEPEPTLDRTLLAKAAGMAGTCSLDTEPSRMRTVLAVLRGPPERTRIVIVKEAASMDPRAELVAREYARYLLSFADGLDAPRQRLTVAQMLANVL